MPIYEYQCSHCRYYLEVIQKVSDAKLKKCPSCGRSTLQKLMSAPVFRLKGSGWYETDFKSEQEQKRNLAAAEKEPAAADAKAGTEAKDAKDTADSKEGKDAAKESKDTKAGGETKGEAAAQPVKPVKAPARGKAATRRPAKMARKHAAGKPKPRRGRR